MTGKTAIVQSLGETAILSARRAAEIYLDAITATRFEGEAVAVARGTGASTGVASRRIAFDSLNRS